MGEQNALGQVNRKFLKTHDTKILRLELKNRLKIDAKKQKWLLIKNRKSQHSLKCRDFLY
ncbi:hypothetical protein DDZ16_10325 [Marinilabilia rubra]|uniref:Uncharacterized protein n=1 Tax=Marinilabilia rubra TaxID=2162893 RepID=A0A2U2B8K5_9BACT|nr:hypothetical protein DDZ16_10325 [Marinilabilia rubra]